MLIHVRHADGGEFWPDRLLFSFEEYSLRQKLDSLTKWIPGKEGDKTEEKNIHPPIKISGGSRVFAQLIPETGDHFFFLLRSVKTSFVHIVISSLSSLERHRGVPMDINSYPEGKNISINYTDLLLGDIQLLYISPESLVQRNFRKDLNLIIGERRIGSVIIDNAHCLSGRDIDFRPSYLRIKRLLDDLETINPKLISIAFTSVKGGKIARDIKNILGMKNITPKKNKTFYDSRISFKNIAVSGNDEKSKTYKKLKQDIIKRLNNEGIFDFPSMIFPGYKDPYKEMEKGKSKGPDSIYIEETRQDVSITTQNENISDKIKVLISTSLGGSAKDRFLRALRAGHGASRVISVWLCDMPQKECEDDMAERRSKIPLCTNKKCPFGRDEFCDYGKEHDLITRLVPDISESLKSLINICNEILIRFRKNSHSLAVNFTEPHANVELGLHYLMLGGIMDFFYIDPGHEKTCFKIYGFKTDIKEETLKGHILNFFNQNKILFSNGYNGKKGDIFEDIDRLICSVDKKTQAIGKWTDNAAKSGQLEKYDQYRDFFHIIIKYMPLFYIYPIREKRKILVNRAWNNKEFLKSKNCIYSDLINTVYMAEDDWECGVCQRCAPDMNFSLKEPIMPGKTGKYSELENFFRSWLENDDIPFDFLTAEEKIKYFNQYINCLIIRCQSILEHCPDNIKALYLLTELSSGSNKEIYSKELVEVIAGALSPLKIIRLCETLQVSREMREVIFDILDDESGAMNSFDGEKWLFQEAARVGKSDEEIALLAGRVMVNQLAKFDFKTHNLKLRRLSKEL